MRQRNNRRDYNRPDKAWLTIPARIVLVLAIAAIGFISIQPVGSGGSIPHLDKVLHAIAYGGLTGVAALALPRLSIWILLICATIYGIGLEFVQGLAGIGRTASVFDALANFAGSGLILLFWVLFVNFRTKAVPD